MPEKDLNYRITGDSTSLTRATDQGSAALRRMEREARRLEQQQARTHAAMESTGRGMLLAGAAIAAGLGLSVKAAIEWESAWAGVLKTVDGSPEQMAALEEEIRGLTAVLPATHAEIAAVAEAAGQLGVQRENVAAFTRTMIDMGEATDLTSDAAATAIARLMNIMQTAPENVNRLASAIVDLGNKGATTESEITSMALRIAGAGATIGLNEQQVLGFAAALSNVGIAAEAGGSSISRVFLEIDKSVKAGDENLTTFAETAGMTAEQFAMAYERDAGGAIASFIAGLGDMQASGGDVNAVLEQLGLTEIRVSDALRRLAGSGDNLASSLRIGAEAWDENLALAEEAERRYGTTAAQLSIARNQVNDFAISIGETLLPAVGDTVTLLAQMVAVIGDLPGPVKTALGVVGLLGAALLVVGGATLMIIPRIAATKAALDTLALSAGRAAFAFRGMSAAMGFMLGPWGAVIAAAAAVATVAFGAWVKSTADARRNAEEFADTLDQVTGAFTDSTRAMIAHRLEEQGLLEVAQRLGLDLATVVDAIMGQASAIAEVNRAIAEGKDANQNQVAMLERWGITVDKSTSDSLKLSEGVETLTGQLDSGVESWRRTNEATGEAGDAMADVDPQVRRVAEGMEFSAEEARGFAEATDELGRELDALFSSLFGVEEAQDAATEAMQRMTEEALENGGALEGNSEAALANRDNVRSVIAADMDLITAMAEAGATSEELRDKTEELRQKFIDQATEAGLSEEAIADYAAAYDDIPSVVETLIEATTDQAMDRIAALKRTIARMEREITISFQVEGFRPRPGGPAVARQHGGPVPGSMSAPVDSTLMAATPGEFVVRKAVAQEHMAALEFLNRTGRMPVTGMAMTAPPPTAMVTPSHTAGVTNVFLTSYSDQFNLKQVQDDLAMRGVS